MPKKTKSNHEAMEHAKEDAKRAMRLAKAKFQKAQSQVSKYLKKNPARAAMIATGIGAAIGAAAAFAIMKHGKGKGKE